MNRTELALEAYTIVKEGPPEGVWLKHFKLAKSHKGPRFKSAKELFAGIEEAVKERLIYYDTVSNTYKVTK